MPVSEDCSFQTKWSIFRQCCHRHPEAEPDREWTARILICCCTILCLSTLTANDHKQGQIPKYIVWVSLTVIWHWNSDKDKSWGHSRDAYVIVGEYLTVPTNIESSWYTAALIHVLPVTFCPLFEIRSLRRLFLKLGTNVLYISVNCPQNTKFCTC